ncbi:hypothetical protein HY214_01585, partial [Candidatus Roizmanbacteria bacterium]|nr:hypothetical protein [Candidatus Roizmanbacteria bacterium]
GLLHGKMKSTEKEEMMRQFTAKTIDILVSTSVVEVGIDIPNATMMIIEGAERFGLAQLHQLRGRVGRSGQQSYTFLFTSNAESKSRDRLSFFTRTTSGLRLAEYDLKIRGAGEVYGTRQHGYLDLKIADLTDYKMIREAGAAVREFLGRYKEAEFTSMVRSRLSFSKEASKVGRD